MRLIKRGVRANGRLYLPGEEAALAAVLTPHQIEYLKSRGALGGDWQDHIATQFSQEGLAEMGEALGGVMADMAATAASALLPEGEVAAAVAGLINPLPQSPDENGNVLTAEGYTDGEGGNLIADGEELSALDSLGVDIVQILTEGGFDTITKIRTATDAELNELPKIGPATIKRIREALQ